MLQAIKDNGNERKVGGKEANLKKTVFYTNLEFNFQNSKRWTWVVEQPLNESISELNIIM